MSSSPLLAAHDLGLTLPTGRVLFSGLSLSIAPGLTGLTGPNGSGKSLLVHLLAGRMEATEGVVHRHVSVGLLAQGGHQRPAAADETVARRLGISARLDALGRILEGGTSPDDYARVGEDGWDLPERSLARLHAVGLGHLSLDRSVAGLSGGELARVSLAGVMLGEPELLILDEPTNDLDAPSIDQLLVAVEGWSGSVLAVSHDRQLLRRADRILELTPSGIRSYGGNYDVYRELREQEVEAARVELEASEASRRSARRDAAQTGSGRRSAALAAPGPGATGVSPGSC